jgi:hypothetical protein
MKRISDKRAATAKLGFNSTFRTKPREPKKLLSITEMKEQGLLKRAKEVEKMPKAKSERAKWKAAADKWFSEFIRLRDSDEFGRVTCVTCSHRGHWRELQCGHWITRGHEATRFDERNCTTQCRGCNYNGGQHLKHAAAIERLHGARMLVELEEKAKRPCHRTPSDYQFLAQTYKARVDYVKQVFPNKYKRA